MPPRKPTVQYPSNKQKPNDAQTNVSLRKDNTELGTSESLKKVAPSKRTPSKRKTAIKANKNIQSYLDDDQTEPDSEPELLKKQRLHVQDNLDNANTTYKDEPDIIDMSEILSIKQEDGVQASDCFQMYLNKPDTNTENHLLEKPFLKTDQILGIKTLKYPTKGPQTIGGCVDTKDNKFQVSCDVCGEQFPTKFSFNRHIKSAHNLDKEQCLLQCKYCIQKSKTTTSLKHHMLMYHLDELNLKTKWFECSHCHLKSMELTDIKDHKQESLWCQGAAILLYHTCTECPFKTDRLSQLQGHIKSHFKGGANRCPHCTFRCTTSQVKKMDDHLDLHKT